MNSIAPRVSIESLLRAEDLEPIVQIHMLAFPGFFMTRMGATFVQRYYESLVKFSKSIVLIARVDGEVIGFAAGFGSPARFYAHYRSRKARIIRPILSAALSRPRLIPEVIRNLRRISNVAADDSEVELSSLAVLPAFSSRGVGQSLLETFTLAARDGGYRSVFLITDARDNDAVNHFYRKRGFTLDGQFNRGKRVLNRLQLTL